MVCKRICLDQAYPVQDPAYKPTRLGARTTIPWWISSPPTVPEQAETAYVLQ